MSGASSVSAPDHGTSSEATGEGPPIQMEAKVTAAEVAVAEEASEGYGGAAGAAAEIEADEAGEAENHTESEVTEPAGPLPPAPEISPLLPPDDLVAGEGGAAAADAVSGGESEAEAGVGLNHLSRSTIVTFFCE